MNTSSIKVKRAATTLAALVLSFGLAALALAAPPKVGDAFPDLAKFNLEGTVPDLRGKVVIVDFFASWCEPCKESFPVLEELHQKYGDKLVIVAVNVDKKKADMDEFLKKHPVTFTVVRDAANKLVAEVKPPTMPSSYVLDKDGKVHSFHRGFKGAETKKKYTEEIEALLK
jgi:cytochrome c biogenesis protein CcmG, thiol:disulfide interchange protein DsbE